MDAWAAVFWILSIAGGLGALYGLHRLGLWMEERGYLYYLHKKPRSSAAGAFVALQRAIEPSAQHVLQVDRVNHQAGEEGTSGQDDPDNSLAKSSDGGAARDSDPQRQ